MINRTASWIAEASPDWPLAGGPCLLLTAVLAAVIFGMTSEDLNHGKLEKAIARTGQLADGAPQAPGRLAKRNDQNDPPEPPLIELPPVVVPPLEETGSEYWHLADEGGYVICPEGSVNAPAGASTDVIFTEYPQGILLEDTQTGDTFGLYLWETYSHGAIYRGWETYRGALASVVAADARAFVDEFWLTFTFSDNQCAVHKTFILYPRD